MSVPRTIVIMMALIPLVCCGQQSDSGKGNTVDHGVSQETQAKTPNESMVSVRSKLPFAFKGEGKVMQLPGAFTLDSQLNPSGPVPPFGHIRSLSVNEATIELLDTELKNGMLSTKEFGNLQVIIVDNIVEFHGTDEQRKRIERFLGKKKSWW